MSLVTGIMGECDVQAETVMKKYQAENHHYTRNRGFAQGIYQFSPQDRTGKVLFLEGASRHCPIHFAVPRCFF